MTSAKMLEFWMRRSFMYNKNNSGPKHTSMGGGGGGGGGGTTFYVNHIRLSVTNFSALHSVC